MSEPHVACEEIWATVQALNRAWAVDGHRSCLAKIAQMATARALGAAVAGMLAFHAKLDIGQDIQTLSDKVATLGAQSKITGGLVQPLERGLNATEGRGALSVAFGRDDLVHFGERLLLLFPTHCRGISACWLDGHIALAQDLRTQFQ